MLGKWTVVRGSLVGLAVFLAVLAPRVAAGQGAPDKTTVESQLLVAGEPGLQYSLSPRGQHLAAVALRGSRQVMVHDGVDGPKFDEILLVPGGSGFKVAWSEDGSRYAYFGRVGQEFVVMVDGNEAHRGPWSAELAGQGQTPVQWLGFTPGGRHWYLVLQTLTARGLVYNLIIDGQAGPPSEDASPVPVWSPDGEHHAYFVGRRTQAGPISLTLIVDGKPAPYVAGEPQFTADGLHLFTKRQVPGTGAVEVLADGQPFMRAFSVQLHMSPVGTGVIGVVGSDLQGGVLTSFLTVGNQKVAGSECVGSNAVIDRVWLRPDGKHYAARCHVPGTSDWIIADGKKGLEYFNVAMMSNVEWTADGRVVYQAIMSGAGLAAFLVVGEEEWGPYQSILEVPRRSVTDLQVQNYQPSPAVIQGNRVGIIARPATPAGNARLVVIDGKAIQAVNPVDLTFSPDGSRFAYIAGMPAQLVVDGVTHNVAVAGEATSSPEWLPKYVWSSDSRHVAYAAAPDARSQQRGIAIDGRLVLTPTTANYNVTFTPDGQHLAWLGWQHGTPVRAIFVDGEKVLEVDGTPVQPEAEAWWSMGEDGVLTLIAQEGDAMKRFRITPGTGNSVEKMLARAVAAR